MWKSCFTGPSKGLTNLVSKIPRESQVFKVVSTLQVLCHFLSSGVLPADAKSKVSPEAFWDVVLRQLGNQSKPVRAKAAEAVGMGLAVASAKGEVQVK